ncbi:MAG: aminotransferase class I/II-fold pyridoxal phosphate-dependent enzyme [Pirellulaceae bacterium]|nr:aminotransferase class I/II-fold pyridoxal phosphate-dependent enzyme [Pirellulaceae bacterium]
MVDRWISKRTEHFDSSGIRRVFDLAAKIENPINLSIGQPDFDVSDRTKEAAYRAIREGKNGYTLTQGIPPLKTKLQKKVDDEFNHDDRELFISSGTSGGLTVAMLSLIDPGDEVILFDPYFLVYPSIVRLAGGVPIIIDTHPDFRIDINDVQEAITDKTKAIIFNNPSNPTGVVATEEEVRGLANLAKEKGIVLISDEIYSDFCFDAPFVSPAKYNDQTIVVTGLSKSHAMTGWRVGFVHGPKALIDAMLRIQQYTFVCAPQPLQWAAVEGLDEDLTDHIHAYQKKRDLIYNGLSDLLEIARPCGAFYIYPKAPGGSGIAFVEKAIKNKILTIPGTIFSKHDSHFRISYAASNETLEQGIESLRKLIKS